MLEQVDITNIQDMIAEAIISNLKTVTDRIDHLDPLIQGKENMYFVCLHSRKFFPADYVKLWGHKYGIGMGGDPRSECLDSEYNVRPSLEGIRSLEDIMHPCKISGAPLDVVFTSSPAPKDRLLIPTYMDRNGAQRGKIMRANQLKREGNKIATMCAIAVEKGLVWTGEGV